MSDTIKLASGVHVYGSTADRYVLSGYKDAVPISDMIKTAATVPGLKGLELVETWHINEGNADEVLADLDASGLEHSMMIPDLWASGKWGNGSLTNRDEKVRQGADHTDGDKGKHDT